MVIARTLFIHCPPNVPSHSQFYNFFTDIIRIEATNHMEYNLYLEQKVTIH